MSCVTSPRLLYSPCQDILGTFKRYKETFFFQNTEQRRLRSKYQRLGKGEFAREDSQGNFFLLLLCPCTKEKDGGVLCLATTNWIIYNPTLYSLSGCVCLQLPDSVRCVTSRRLCARFASCCAVLACSQQGMNCAQPAQGFEYLCRLICQDCRQSRGKCSPCNQL